MPSKSCVTSLSAFFVYLTHLLTLISITVIMPREISFFDSVNGFLLLAISWVPLLLVICVCIFYSILINPPRYIKVRKYIYANGLMLLISLSILINIKQILLYLNIYIVSAMLILFTITSTVISMIINRLLYKSSFNFNKEIRNLLSVSEELKKLSCLEHLNKLNVSMYLFAIPFCIQANFLLFITLTFIIATFLFFRVLRIKAAFQENYSLHKTNSNIVVVNYCISVILAIVLYNYSRFLSFVLLFSSFLMVYIIMSRIARHYYTVLDDNGLL